MLGNCEKFALISSTTNEWPQNDQNLIMASKNNMVMEKPTQEQIQQQHGLKCPRCDSSNTKFCYYNNYSLSQPRHFCKACKRYWTRGGTLRNVPVGGGCRKNKRVKRPAAAAAIDPMPSTSSAPVATANPNGQSQIDHINPLFYGLQSSISFPRFNNSRVDMAPVYDQYDLQPQMNALGFSSAGLMASDVTSKSVLSSYPVSFFGSLTSSASASNNLNQPKFKSGGGLGDARGANSFLGFNPINEDMQMQGMKIGECQSGLNRIEQMGGSSDPNNLIWNATGVGDWLDPANNFGSSVPSLI